MGRPSSIRSARPGSTTSIGASQGFKQYFHDWLAAFTEESNITDVVLLRRRRLQVLGATFMAVLSAGLLPVAAAARNDAQVSMVLALAGAVLWTAVALLLRKPWGRPLAAVVASTAFFGIMTVSILLVDGVDGQSKWLLILAPWGATFAVGGRAGMAITAGAIILLLGCFVVSVFGAPSVGIEPQSHLDAWREVVFPSSILLFGALFAAAIDRDRGIMITALGKAHEDLTMVLSHFPDGILILRGGQVDFVNDRVCALLGHASKEILVGMSTADLLAQELDAWVESAANDASSKDLQFIHAGGSKVLLETSFLGTLKLATGAVNVLSVRDSSPQRKQQSDRALQDRLVSVGVLAAGVAHEINNPLAYLLANLTFVKDEMTRMHGVHWARELPDLWEALYDAEEGAQRVSRIVRDLRTFSRNKKDELAQVDVVQVLESTIKMCFNEIRHSARLVRDYQELPRITSNEGRLAQVFLNIIINAAQSIPEGHVASNEIRIRALSDEHGGVLVEVSDTGCGIHPDDMPYVFDPFFTKRTLGAGTGLGLSISHRIVQDLGGSLEVESEVNAGTTFRVRLPQCPPNMMSSANLQAVRSNSAPRVDDNVRILIVDDEERSIKSLRRSLKHFDLTAAGSGRKAIELCQATQFDVIVCDMMMPDVSGKEVYEWLKEHRPGMVQRVIFVSGGVFSDDFQQFLDMVPNRLVDKPYTLDELQSAIQEVLANTRS